MALECIDPEAQIRLTNDIFFTVGKGGPLRLSPESKKHLTECHYCGTDFPRIVEKCTASAEWSLENEVINLARRRDPSVFKKRVSSGVALFRAPKAGETLGIFVLVDDSYRTLMKGRMSQSEFDSWQEPPTLLHN